MTTLTSINAASPLPQNTALSPFSPSEKAQIIQKTNSPTPDSKSFTFRPFAVERKNQLNGKARGIIKPREPSLRAKPSNQRDSRRRGTRLRLHRDRERGYRVPRTRAYRSYQKTLGRTFSPPHPLGVSKAGHKEPRQREPCPRGWRGREFTASGLIYNLTRPAQRLDDGFLPNSRPRVMRSFGGRCFLYTAPADF